MATRDLLDEKSAAAAIRMSVGYLRMSRLPGNVGARWAASLSPEQRERLLGAVPGQVKAEHPGSRKVEHPRIAPARSTMPPSIAKHSDTDGSDGR